MRVVAVVSAKGGVGKTTVSANLASALARQGRTVLAVDLDPQNALGLHFGLDPRELRGISRATLAGEDWRGVVLQSPRGVYALPYGVVNENDRLAFEARLDRQPDWLSRHLRRLDLPDDALVVLDTPPGPSAYLRQALGTAHLAVVVALPDAASYAALPLAQRLVQAYCTPRADFIGALYLVNQADNSRQLSRDVTNVMRSNFGERLAGAIHQDPAVSEALASDTTVLDYDRHSQATQDFVAFAERVAAVLGLQRRRAA
ncbi:cellulose biosynthesis protein BcsQ [Xylophilus sp.]|uniref:cellulose biosynthesis protein BcsQ n=1 Tax=Xylophilus sp. TaxID=2653893 RepID=UPI0013B869A5|nr:cellulose biosynthesis protein BcsQ [Xylophilus sp.]KAF1050049.1 MAG: Chromosome-partitioning ATPase Soj [Xylophilus sp.]